MLEPLYIIMASNNGQGAKQSNYEAFHWYEKAVHQGLAKAQFNLGKVYREGQGVNRSVTEAFRWSEKAAHQDNSTAQA